METVLRGIVPNNKDEIDENQMIQEMNIFTLSQCIHIPCIVLSARSPFQQKRWISKPFVKLITGFYGTVLSKSHQHKKLVTLNIPDTIMI